MVTTWLLCLLLKYLQKRNGFLFHYKEKFSSNNQQTKFTLFLFLLLLVAVFGQQS